jgi:hypothetical protein
MAGLVVLVLIGLFVFVGPLVWRVDPTFIEHPAR